MDNILNQIVSRLAAIEHQLGLVQQWQGQPGDTRPPDIPLIEEWRVEPTKYESISKVILIQQRQRIKIAEVYHRDSCPQLATMIARLPQLYHHLRELVLLFQVHDKALGTPWATAFYNGRPINPTLVREYVAACALLAECDPNNPMPDEPTKPVPLGETTIGLGPIELVDNEKKRLPRLSLWKLPDGNYIMSNEEQPEGPNGEVLVRVGTVKLDAETKLVKYF